MSETLKYPTVNQTEDGLSDKSQDLILEVVPHQNKETVLTVKLDNHKIPTLYQDLLQDNYLNYRRTYNINLPSTR